MHRDFERDDPRRRYRRDDDPRDDPRERYGNEEDEWSRQYRRAYAEGDLPRRLHDDRPYDRPGYEPEFGRPGGRENVDLDRGRREGHDHPFERRYAGDPYGYDWEQPPDRRRENPGYGRGDDRWQGGYYGQGRRFSGQPFEREGHGGWGTHGDPRRGGQFGGQGGRQERSTPPSYGPPASPYEQGEVSSWYGGDTGMGDPGSSRYGDQPGYGSRSGYGGQQGGQYQGRYGSAPGQQFWREYGEQFGGQSRQQYGGGGDRFGAGSGPGTGRFGGRGPRGYRRSDERIREDVCEHLTDNAWLDASEVEVNVAAGEVFLSGTVDSRYAKRLAESIAESVSGVTNVQNNLRVQHYEAAEFGAPTAGATPAGDITASAGTSAASESDLGDSHTPPAAPPSSRAAGRS